MYSNKIIDIWEGQYRVFFNFYKGNQRITLGFPKRNSFADDVYFKINDDEQPRISFYEAKRYLNQGMITMLAPRVKGLGFSGTAQKYLPSSGKKTTSTDGYCTSCNKKLRGDTSKKLCYACWKKTQR